MRIRNIVLVLAVVFVGAGVFAANARAAVLVELFTAQGCSTCPPADRLLSAMGSDPELSKQVVPLAFHVDYWNTSSWRDRFSDAAWTKRQNDYVIGAGGTQVYTPQIVIAGGKQCIGSDVKCIKEGVETAEAQTQGTVIVTPTMHGDQIEVAVTAQLPAGQRALDLMVAVYESGLDTEVSGGENAHKTLHDDYVVRRLQRAFEVSGMEEKKDSVTLRLDKDWQRGNLGVVAFLQDPRSHQVYGAASAPLR